MSTALPRIAVLLAAYNGTQWIEEQLDSIRLQEGVSADTFISVDVSEDDTYAMCQRYASKYGSVVLLPPAGPFGGAAPNFFRLFKDVDLGSYEFVSLADQDDIWQPNKLIRAVSCLKAHRAQGYSANVTAFWPDGHQRLLNKAQPQRPCDYFFEAAGPGCTYVFDADLAAFLKRQILTQWEVLKEVSLHDWYFYAIARHAGHSWHIDPESSMRYRQHRHNQFGANVGGKALIARVLKIRQGWWFAQVRIIALLVGRACATTEPDWLGFRRADFAYLAAHARSFRRRSRDQIFFFLLCIAMAIRPKPIGR